MPALFPLIWIIVWAVRAANKGKGGGATRSRTAHPAGVDLTAQHLLRLLGLLVLLILWVGLAGTASDDGWSWEEQGPIALAIVITTAACFPAWLGPACAVVPVRFGRALAILVGPNWARSHVEAGAAILVARHRRLSDVEADWLMAKLRNSSHCYALTWVAAGAIRANRGDVAVARFLYGIAGRSPPMAGSEPARGMAREWLWAEAMGRGAWTEARAWVALGEGLHGGLKSLLSVTDAFEARDRGAHAEARRLARRAITRMVLVGRWRLALAVARATRPDRFATPLSTGGLVGPGPLATWHARLSDAFGRHARAMTGQRVEDVQAACLAWDAVLADDALRAWAKERGEALHANADVVARLVDARVAELAELMWRERWFTPGTGTFGRASDAALDRAWAELKDRARAAWVLADVNAPASPERRQAIPFANDAFLAWEPLRALSDAMLRDRPGDRGTIFQAMHAGSLHLAVMLYNTRGFKYFGNMVFRWLRHAGDGVMTDSLKTVLDGNIQSGI